MQLLCFLSLLSYLFLKNYCAKFFLSFWLNVMHLPVTMLTAENRPFRLLFESLTTLLFFSCPAS